MSLISVFTLTIFYLFDYSSALNDASSLFLPVSIETVSLETAHSICVAHGGKLVSHSQLSNNIDQIDEDDLLSPISVLCEQVCNDDVNEECGCWIQSSSEEEDEEEENKDFSQLQSSSSSCKVMIKNQNQNQNENAWNIETCHDDLLNNKKYYAICAHACESEDVANTPQLYISIGNSAPIDGLYARIISATKKKQGGVQTLSEWKELSSSCSNNQNNKHLSADLSDLSDFYFDDFNNINDKWIAVALYNCGSNDIAISSVGIWNGKSEAILDYWCQSTALPSKSAKCGLTKVPNMAYCKRGSNSPPFDEIIMNDSGCVKMVFSTRQTGLDGTTLVGRPYAGQLNIGKPPCATQQDEGEQEKVFAIDNNLKQTSVGIQSHMLLSMISYVGVAMIVFILCYCVSSAKYNKAEQEPLLNP